VIGASVAKSDKDPHKNTYSTNNKIYQQERLEEDKETNENE
jgi:hypothetical protein